MERERVDVDVGGRKVAVEIYRPPGGGESPGILLLHEAYGLRGWYREDAEDLASRGYLVHVPDLYTGGALRYCIRAMVLAAARANRADSEVNREVGRLLDHLAADFGCNGRLGMLGACLSGGFVIQMAKREDMAAPVLYHHSLGFVGGGLPESESTDGIRRLQAHFSNRDPFCPRSRQLRLKERLGERIEAFNYDMPHGFRSVSRGRPESAQVWERTLRFFDEQLHAE